MDISTYLGNLILNAFRGGGAGTSITAPTTLYVSAHTADPGLTGASEVGVAVASAPTSTQYVRGTVAFAAASAKSVANSGQVNITMPATGSFNVAWLGIWDGPTSGANFLFRVPLLGTAKEATVTSASPGVIETGEAHGLLVDDRVIVDNLVGAMPTGLTAGVVYYVGTAPTTHTLTLSTAAANGTPVNTSAAGGVILRKVNLQPFNASNVLQVSASSLTAQL